MKRIAVFYHSLYSDIAIPIIQEAFETMAESGLADAADKIQVCFNGQPDGRVKIPAKASVLVHPEGSCNENLTIVEVEKFIKENPTDWYVLYFHSKGATHEPSAWHFPLVTRWRHCMLNRLVRQWREPVEHLACFEACGCHWMERQLDGSLYLFGGNFWWARSEFLATVPSIYERHRNNNRPGNIYDWANRFEAEVWIGFAPRPPIVKDYCPGHPGKHG